MSKISAYTALTAPAASDVLPVVDISDTSMAASGTTKKMTLAQLGVPLQPSGDTTGAADTAAIGAQAAAGGTVTLAAGTFWTTGLTLPGGARLAGAGAGWYGTAAPAAQRTIIKLAAAANHDVITIPAGNPYGLLQDLEIDGNKTAQTTAGRGITFADAGAAEECGWELRRVQVHDTFTIGLYVGNNRQAVYGEHVLVIGAGQHGVQVVGSDSTWVKLMIGASGSGWKGLVASGYMTRYIGGEVWSTPSGVGAVVVSPENTFIGMGFDRNGQQGILLDTGSDSVSIVGCTFHSNSQQADNTYSDIKVGQAGNYSVAGCAFGALDGGITNRRKYCVETGGNPVAQIGNNQAAAATGTGYSDGPGVLAEGVDINTAGFGLAIKEGANAKQGTAVVVANTSVTANSRIFLTSQAAGGTVGAPYVSTRTAGTSFSIKSTTPGDTSPVAYLITEPG